MRKFFLGIFVLLSLPALSAAWIEVAGNSDRDPFQHVSAGLQETAIRFSLPGYEFEEIRAEGQVFARISNFNEGSFTEEGKPDLPRFTRLFAIPDQGTVEFQITGWQEEILENVLIYPVQETLTAGSHENTSFLLDTDYYQSTEPFPAQMVEVGTPVILRDVRLVSVSVNPFQYEPSSRSLRIITELELTLITAESQPGENPKNTSSKHSRTFDKIYRSMIQNYDEITASRDDVFQDPCYLFIYPTVTNLLTNLQYLADWKKQMGYEVHLASTSETGTSTTSIKNYIQNAYDTWENPPEFICFIGDANGSIAIPTFFESYSGYGGEGDHPYAQLAGNDILADVITGRISVSTINELQTYIAKVLNYEKQPYMNNTDWFTRAVLVGDPSSSGPSCIYVNHFVREMIEYYNPEFSFYEYYSGNYSNGMTTSLNNGVSYLNYRGYIGMSSFGNTQINSLNNGFMLPYAVFMTCDTGSFASTYSIARSEAFIRKGSTTTAGGAIAAVGTATSGTHTTFNNAVDAGLYYGIFVDHIYNPGGALVRGKLHLYNSFPNNPSNRVNMFSHWNTLMGDPGLQLWTGLPQPLMVVYDSQVNVGTNYLEVTVTAVNGSPVEGAWVCALLEGQFFERDYTDAAGKVYLAIDPVNTGSASLTVTAHNFIPHLGSVNVISANTFVNLINYLIDDDNSGTSAGNGDGVINPGESIELKVGLHNYGTQTANNVTAVISSGTPFITITDAEESFGNINGGNTNYAADDFDFTVDANVLGGSQIQLDMLISDSSGSEWEDHLFLTVEGANLYVSSYQIDDPNGILDPGDTVELIVTLMNTGTVPATGLQGMLSCSNQFVSLEDSLATWGNIAAGMQGNNNADRFVVNLDDHAISGMQIVFNIQLSNAAGFEQTVSFLVDVGTVTSTDPLGPDSYGYYAYDSTDETYDQAPIYNWIEIDPAFGGSGVLINLYDNGNTGDVQNVNMPFSFNFYGINYNMISVCSNGWIAPGGSTQASFMNSPIPGPQGPSPMIAPFWDDLKMGSGHVYYYHDLMEHAFIVQWSRVQNEFTSSLQNFQALIYDPAVYPTVSGDAVIVFQYATVNNTSVGNYSGYPINHGQYSTVGLEDHTFTRGLQYTFNNTYPTAAAPLQSGLAIKFTTEGGGAQAPPIVNLNPTVLNFLLQPGTSDIQQLAITNTGEANLIYSISKSYAGFSDDPGRGHGGPDNFGYQWFDSNEPDGPTYNWRDITGLGTQVAFIDNNTGSDLLPIGFDFYFYGTYYSQFRINPNGWIGFGDDCNQWNNLSLPHPQAPNPAILPFWDDLAPLTSGDVYYYSTADSLIVWFDDVIHTPGNYNGTYDFQLIIYPTGDIVFQYRTMTGSTNSATIGIQDAAAGDALQVTYNGSYVQNELCVIFRKIVDWMQFSPGYGFIQQNETVMIDITVDAQELIPGIFYCDLILTTNDPNASNLIVPVNLQVSNEFPYISLSQNSFDFGTVFLGEEVTDTLTVFNLGNQVLVVSDITITLPEYSVNVNSLNIEPDDSAEIYITFTPLENIVYNAVMSISSNDPVHPVVEVMLNGNSIYASIGLSQTSFDFGAVSLATEVIDTLVVTNLGTDLLIVSEMNVSGEVFSLNISSFNLTPGNSADVLISFIPTDEMEYNETLTISSNDPFNPVLVVELAGSGVNPVNLTDIPPLSTEVYPNYPNPFNPQTTIRYSVAEAGKVAIAVYNIRGEKVRTLVSGWHEPQWFEVVWDGCDDNRKPVSSGVYFYRFKAGQKTDFRKMLLIK